MSAEKLAARIKAIEADTDLTADQKKRQIELAKLQFELDAENEKRKGKGTRLTAGMTRGKGSQVIQFEEFDTAQPDTLPASMKEFGELMAAVIGKPLTEADFVGYLIEGANAALYRDASDPIAEFVNPAWDKDTQAAFRMIVKNTVKVFPQPLDEVAKDVRAKLDKAKGLAA